jgi:hypothetical protein
MALFQASNFLAVQGNPYSTFGPVIYQQCSQESLLNAYALKARIPLQ